MNKLSLTDFPPRTHRHAALQVARGASVIKMLLVIPVALVLLLALVFAFFEGRKAYWDYRVREMCAKDGGIRVYERVLIPSRYLDQDRNIKIPAANMDPSRKPFAWEAKSDDLFYYVWTHKAIVEGYLAAGRDDIKIIRATDKKVLGEAVIFGRSGGDFPTFAYPSSFRCPAHQNLEEAVFIKPQLSN